MYLSNSKRISNLLIHLASNPHDLFFYFSKSLTKSSPLDLGLPWWSLGAIRYLEKNHSKYNRVFEYGSGGSTIFLGNNFRNVKTIEHDPNWFDQVNSRLESNQLKSVNLGLADIDLACMDRFERCQYYHALDERVDLVVVDGEDQFGPDSTWSARVSCFLRAQEFVSLGGLIIVDDSWRYPEIKELSLAKQIRVFQGIGPCRKGITSTDLHFY